MHKPADATSMPSGYASGGQVATWFAPSLEDQAWAWSWSRGVSGQTLLLRPQDLRMQVVEVTLRDRFISVRPRLDGPDLAAWPGPVQPVELRATVRAARDLPGVVCPSARSLAPLGSAPMSPPRTWRLTVGEIEAALRAVIAEVSVATKDDLAALTRRVAAVEQKVESLPSLVECGTHRRPGCTH